MDDAYRVEWSPEKRIRRARRRVPVAVWLAPTSVEAMLGIVGIVGVVEQVAAEMADAQDVDSGGV